MPWRNLDTEILQEFSDAQMMWWSIGSEMLRNGFHVVSHPYGCEISPARREYIKRFMRMYRLAMRRGSSDHDKEIYQKMIDDKRAYRAKLKRGETEHDRKIYQKILLGSKRRRMRAKSARP